MKTELTPEEEAMLPEVRDFFIEKALDCGEINKEACERYLKFVAGLDKEYPTEFKIQYFESPLAIQYAINQFVKTGDCNPEGIIEWGDKQKDLQYFTLSSYSDLYNYVWTSFYYFFRKIGVLQNEDFNTYIDNFLEANIYEYAKLPDRILVCRKPLELNRDAQLRLHSTTRPAVTWKDGFKQYFVKGIEVPTSWIEDKITLHDIDNASNAELRRIAMEIYGYKNYMMDSGAVKIAEDEYGELFKKEVPDDEPIVMVSMLNCSPEPGEAMGLEQREEFRATELPMRGAWYKRYMQRVPPNIETPAEALAWSMGITVEEYKERMRFET